MQFTTVILATLAATVSALPASEIFPRAGQCSTNSAFPIPLSGLPALPTGLKVKYVLVGQGVQQYSCAGKLDTEAPAQTGAIAELYNGCALSKSPILISALRKIPGGLMKLTAGVASFVSQVIQGPLRIGDHNYQNGSPYFSLHDGTTFTGAAKAKVDSPGGTSNIKWVYLEPTTPGGDIKAVYRVDTALGVQPATCAGQNGNPNIERRYAALYILCG